MHLKVKEEVAYRGTEELGNQEIRRSGEGGSGEGWIR